MGFRMATVKISRQIGKGDMGKPVKQQRLGLGKGAFQSRIDRLLDQTRGGVAAISEGENGRLSKCFVQLLQGHGREIG